MKTLAAVLVVVLSTCSAPPSTDQGNRSEPSASPTLVTAMDVDLDAAATGSPPSVAYLDRGVLYRADGSTLKKPALRFATAVAVLGRRTHAAVAGEVGTRMVFNGRGKRVGLGLAGDGPVLSPDGRLLAWLMPRRGVPALEPQGTSWAQPDTVTVHDRRGRTTRLGQPDTAERLVAITGGGACAVGCEAYVVVPASGDRRGRSAVLGRYGRRSLGPGVQVVDVSVRDDIAGWRRPKKRRKKNCAMIWAADGTRLWRGCGVELASFSPSGGLVVGSRRRAKSKGRAEVTVRARTGEEVASYTLPTKVSPLQYAWEDDGTLLVRLEERRGRQSVLRLGVNASAEPEYAVAPHRAGEPPRTLLLAVQ